MKMRKHFHPPFAFAYDAPDNALGKYAVQYRFPASPKGFANYGICRGRSNRLRKKSYYNTGSSGTEGSLRKVSASDGTLYGNAIQNRTKNLSIISYVGFFSKPVFMRFSYKSRSAGKRRLQQAFHLHRTKDKKGPPYTRGPFPTEVVRFFHPDFNCRYGNLTRSAACAARRLYCR